MLTRLDAFLSPGHTLAATLGRAVRTGVALAAVAFALGLSLVLVMSVLAPSMEPISRSVDFTSWHGYAAVLVVAPVVETAAVAAAWAAMSALTSSTVLPVPAIAVGAAWIHPHNGVFMLVPAVSFAGMTWQYARHRKQIGVARAWLAVSLTHATLNACVISPMLLGLE